MKLLMLLEFLVNLDIIFSDSVIRQKYLIEIEKSDEQAILTLVSGILYFGNIGLLSENSDEYSSIDVKIKYRLIFISNKYHVYLS